MTLIESDEVIVVRHPVSHTGDIIPLTFKALRQ